MGQARVCTLETGGLILKNGHSAKTNILFVYKYYTYILYLKGINFDIYYLF
jgi:hypothetical protein